MVKRSAVKRRKLPVPQDGADSRSLFLVDFWPKASSDYIHLKNWIVVHFKSYRLVSLFLILTLQLGELAIFEVRVRDLNL